MLVPMYVYRIICNRSKQTAEYQIYLQLRDIADKLEESLQELEVDEGKMETA